MKLFNLKSHIIVLALLMVMELSGTAYLVQWRELFWSSVSDKNAHDFWQLIIIFSVVAIALCAVSGLETYLQNKIALQWRYRLTRKILGNIPTHIEGHQQRVQEDCRDYPLLILDIARFCVMQTILVIYFLYVIVHQVGTLYVVVPLLYAGTCTGISYYIAFPLIKLNYLNQVLEAGFRQSLSKLGYGKVHRNNMRMFKKTKHLNYFQYFYLQINVIFPYLLLAPLYFAATISFGVLMQVSSTISHLTDSLGMIVTRFDQVNKMLSCRKRLKEVGVL